MKKKILSYNEYLDLKKILDSQNRQSEKAGNPIHDEMLFIIIHQTYELWFKQIIFELYSIQKILSSDTVHESQISIIVSRLTRVIEIFKILNDQVSVLETMTPHDFLEFRNLLYPASGFQSGQFRKIENMLGLKDDERIKFSNKDYKDFLAPKDKKILDQNDCKSIFFLIDNWLSRTPFLDSKEFSFWEKYKNAVYTMIQSDMELINNNNQLSDEQRKNRLKEYKLIKSQYDTLFIENEYNKLIKSGKKRLSREATLASLFIMLYRDEPMFHMPHLLITKLIDLDDLMKSWRNKHAMLAFRMIGSKIGTGGSSGYNYLKSTVHNHTVFSDFTSLSTFLIPRSNLPKLPANVKESFGFYYSSKED